MKRHSPNGLPTEKWIFVETQSSSAIKAAVNTMDNNDDTFETRSVCSNISRVSQRSSASAIAARARAKAEAARAQASFAQREADMIKAQAYIEEEQQKAAAEAARKKAELQASLHKLRLESAAAAAITEANVLEAAAENEFGELDRASLKCEYSEHKYMENPKPEPHQDSKLLEPTSTPVRQLTMDNGETAGNNTGEGKEESSEISCYELCDLPVQQTSKLRNNATPYYPEVQSSFRTGHLKREQQWGLNLSKDTCSHQTQSHNTRPFSGSYQPPQPQKGAAPRTEEPCSSSTTDLAKYLIRHEMISSGLLSFDDHPENYWAWKASFCSSTEDLNLTAREELDLLCKWLGPKSSEHAKRIRSVHIHDAAAGVSMVWQRLEDCYGAPEAIENALLKKVDDFPKITSEKIKG